MGARRGGSVKRRPAVREDGRRLLRGGNDPKAARSPGEALNDPFRNRAHGAKGGNFVGPYPSGVGDFAAVRTQGAGRPAEGQREDQVEVLFAGVLSVAEREKGPGDHGQGGFFQDLAHDGVMGRFILFHVAAGERPSSPAGIVGALHKQDAAAADDQASNPDGETPKDDMTAAGTGGAETASFFPQPKRLATPRTEALVGVGGLNDVGRHGQRL